MDFVNLCDTVFGRRSFATEPPLYPPEERYIEKRDRDELAREMYTPELGIMFLEGNRLVSEFLEWCKEVNDVSKWYEYRMRFALGEELWKLKDFVLDDIEAFADYLDLEED